jgi:hypothetical protein
MKHKRVKLSISIALVIFFNRVIKCIYWSSKSTTTTAVPKTIVNLRKLAFIILFFSYKIFNQVENSVVQVISTIESGNNSNLRIIINGNPITRNQTALGSGFDD